jgi:nitrite reductase (NADH) large subunit
MPRNMQPEPAPRKTVVVIGNGMVGHRFCEAMARNGGADAYQVLVFGEEQRPAYDRVNLSKYFDGKSAADLALTNPAWYREQGITLYTGHCVDRIARGEQAVYTRSGSRVPYDYLVLATGSYPFVPPAPGMDKRGVFVYRTIEDLDAIIAYAKDCKSAAVIGGGLLGLEAAKAVRSLGLSTHVVEFAPRLMPRQLDDAGSNLLLREIKKQGVEVLLNHATESVLGNGSVRGLKFRDGESLAVDMVVVSAGIRPRDELAKAAGLALAERGGIAVSDALTTSDPNIFAIGECAAYGGMVYGLVAPGYEMAEIVAKRLMNDDARFAGADISTKLKLLGVDVASFGDPFTQDAGVESVEYRDVLSGIYKKIVFSADGRHILGGILVGDSSLYATLSHYARSGEAIPGRPYDLLGGAADASASAMPDSAQVCSCNNVSKAELCKAVCDGATTVGELKSCTRAGTGCGGCVPLVTDILHEQLKALGVSVKKVICEHFPLSRQELFHGVKIRGLKSFDAVLDTFGKGDGCEVCKPAVASILASLWNEHLANHANIQDTNDRFLANIQRRGTYSIVPRVPGGEITPEKLMTLGAVAQKYALYCKITGGQRIDLLGARVEQLPEIWDELIAAGFESGHAYGKAVRTVKSCVGSTWCRFGVQDSTTFAIRIEERYRGIRAPHKLKFAVSGCVRECAEAQCKDVGLIATENGWNLYVCGNGGAKPRHADLLVADIDDEAAIRYMDRFLMYYIHTADPLTRTSVWLDKLEGGLDQVRDAVINDSLGLCETLEADMARLVESYQCEWKAVCDAPEKRALFRHFANNERPDANLHFTEERGQRRPADWPGRAEAPTPPAQEPEHTWWNAGRACSFPENAGMAVEYGPVQLAVFNFTRRGKWYATQNMCPHQQDMVLARGMIGEKAGEAKVACPLHKKQFSLETGACVSGDPYEIVTFEAKVEDGFVYLFLPPVDALEQQLPKPAKACAHACT